MHCLYTNYTSNNPAGIKINLGYYALCECIIKGTQASDALLRWCGVHIDKTKRKPYTPRAYVAPDKRVNERVIQLYRENPQLTNTEIAKLVNRSKSFVTFVLKRVGVRRSRWDNYKKGE